MSERKGMTNRYVCASCGGSIVTKNAADGTTPFMVGCRATRGCKGAMQSSFYRVDQSLPAAWEWYRPGKQEQKRIRRSKPYGGEIIEHVELGGLLLRRIGTHPSPAEAGS